MKKTIVFTGGGSGGHVVPALTLIDDLKDQLEIHYIGSYEGIEKKLVSQKGVVYHSISTGKLRRYLSLQNILDLFKVAWGTIQSFFILLKLPSSTLIFSTGGFVTVPVVISGWLLRRKIYIHEQTTRMGLANKIASFFSKKIFISFASSIEHFPKDKTVFSGYPLKKECYQDQVVRDEILSRKLQEIKKPILFVTGGGNGSLLLNEKVKENLSVLKEKYFIFHQTGKNFVNDFSKYNDENYQAFDFLSDGILDIYKISDIVISRAGAGTVSELLTLGKKSIFVPLKIAQKNEQYHNAMSAKEEIGSVVVEEDDFKKVDFLKLLSEFNQEGLNSSNKFRNINGREFLIGEILK